MSLADTSKGHRVREQARSERREVGRRGARRALRVVVVATAAGALSVSTVPNAQADPDDRGFPTQQQVEAAERQVEATAADVGAIQASLVLANQRLENAAVHAEMASEAYNGALWRLDAARADAASARAEAAKARRTMNEQRRAIAALVAATYQQSGEVTALSAMMGADGPEGILDEYATFQSASDSLQADYDRFAASDALAQVFEERAEAAQRKQEQLAREAEAAKEAATSAAASAQAAAAQIAGEKEQLIRRLAAAQDISVSLARKRQTALEEIARRRAAERSRAEAEAAAAAAARASAARRAPARPAAKDNRRRDQQTDRQPDQRPDQRPDQGSQDQPQPPRHTPRSDPSPATPPPAPAPPPPSTPPGGRGGADRAIAFATAQLGEAYVWGAAGPDAWDCSGLMLAAWGAAGVSLPHYSVAQYYAGTPISSGDLRPGDLVFWGSSSSPESIHHVAMYIGGGQIVHAPRTGRPVSVDGLYYWTPPNFFVRV